MVDQEIPVGEPQTNSNEVAEAAKKTRKQRSIPPLMVLVPGDFEAGASPSYTEVVLPQKSTAVKAVVSQLDKVSEAGVEYLVYRYVGRYVKQTKTMVKSSFK